MEELSDNDRLVCPWTQPIEDTNVTEAIVWRRQMRFMLAYVQVHTQARSSTISGNPHASFLFCMIVAS